MEKWQRDNQRRIFLIRKRRDEGISAAEEQELDRLQVSVSAVINKKFPLPTLEEAERGG